jgi:Transglycosylase SLT domain
MISRHPLLAGSLALGLGLAAASSARAELIVFDDGRVVKAAGYRLLAEELEISLPGGGSYRVELARVDRIVDDEIVIDSIAVEPDLAASGGPFDLSYRSERKPLFGSPYDAIIEREAKTFDVDASLVSALIRAESNYEPRAVSRKGARGLMQLMPATAKRLSVRRPFDPESNVKGGVKYLRELVDRFGHRPDLVLAAYNAGEGAVEAYGGVPPYRETIAYVGRILAWCRPAEARPAASAPAVASPGLETRN